MGRRNLVGEETIRFRFELIHHDSQHTTARFTRAPAGRLHNAEITAGTDCESRFGEEFACTHGLMVFGISLTTFGAAKYGNNALRDFGHFLTSPLSINEPFSL